MSDARPTPILSARRHQLASFEHAYRLAIQRRRASGIQQFVIRTGDPMQPFRTTSRVPAKSESILALVA